MSILGTAGSDLVWLGKKIKAGIMAASTDAAKVVGVVDKSAPEIEAVSEAIIPGSSKAEEVALAIFDKIVQAVEDAGEAAGASALNVTMDQTTVADVKALLPSIKKML